MHAVKTNQMSDQVLINFKLDRDLKDAFVAAAAASDRTASQVLRELIRAYVKKPVTELKVTEEPRN